MAFPGRTKGLRLQGKTQASAMGAGRRARGQSSKRDGQFRWRGAARVLTLFVANEDRQPLESG
jgi:hypothetical protein